MAEQGLTAMLVTNGMNRRYLSGFTGSSGALFLTLGAAYLVTDFRYFEQAAQQAGHWTLWKQSGDLTAAIVELLKEQSPTRLGFEADDLTVSMYNTLTRGAPSAIEWVETQGLVRSLRAVKSAEEVALIRQAQAITDEAAKQLPRLIQPGRREREVAWELEQLLRELGADEPAFAITVASGANAALPHHKPSERQIGPNETVLVDFGAKLQGYHSDMTRTYFTGEPSEQYRRVYGIVLDALQEAERQLKVGHDLRAGDAIARDLIGAAGHGEAFGHSLGHGVGLDIHELPSLSFRAEEGSTLPASSAITIEPGIYLPGWGGVRLEDLALITDEGVEILTQTPLDVDAWRKGQEDGK